MERDKFSEFVSHMHMRHMQETPKETNYKEFGKPYEEYVLSNLDFLQQEYERQKSNQARARLDEFNIPGGLRSM
tara:strand:- start:931 stop:1152 length:222 start_codon:yes stop_codon:yes gene_type:complete